MADVSKITTTDGNTYDFKDATARSGLSNKMDKIDPEGEGSFSMNRATGSTVGNYSHVEGYDNTASGYASHAEGQQTTASGYRAHAEGLETTASGPQSHAEGDSTEASGYESHAEGWGTIAASDNQHAGGKYNIADNANTYAEIIGNGSDDSTRSNARTLDWQGNETISGDLYFNGGATGLTAQLAAKQMPDEWFYNDSLTDVTGLASGGTWARLASFSIPKAGTWLISAAVQYPSNSTGYRSVGLYVGTAATPTDVSGIRFQQTVPAANGAATNLVLTAPTTIDYARTCWIMGRQSSGAPMGTTSSPIRIRVSGIRLTPTYT